MGARVARENLATVFPWGPHRSIADPGVPLWKQRGTNQRERGRLWKRAAENLVGHFGALWGWGPDQFPASLWAEGPV